MSLTWKTALWIFFIGLLLMCIAYVLYPILALFSIVYTVLRVLFKYEFNLKLAMVELGLYFKANAQSIDQSGNVVIQYPANDILIDSENGHAFGDADEDISGVLGKNKLNNTNLLGGQLISTGLNFIDPDHVEIAAGHPSNN
jgi:hypothetical protein